MKLVEVHLHDEVPRIGSGLRRLVVLKLGWKWVSVLYLPTMTRAKVSRAIWDTLNAREIAA